MERQYIGARYVPKFYQGSNGTEWDTNVGYDPLTVVTYLSNSYTSKKAVPASIGNPMENPLYWASTGNYNAQVESYRQEVQVLLTTNKYTTPEKFGAIGDGVTNDTKAVQDAINSGLPVLFSKTYLVCATGSPWYHAITIPSGAYLFGDGTIKLEANNYSNYDILYMTGVSDVIIRDIKIIGDLETHGGASGEWGYGIDIDGCANITIDNVSVTECWGDGIIVNNLIDANGVYAINKNVKIVNCTVTDNGRNNISVSKGEDIEVGNCYIYNAKRTAPKAGIDVEPDANETVKNITIHDNIIVGNVWGIEVVVSNTPKVSGVENCLVANNLLVDNLNPLGAEGIVTNSANVLVFEGNVIQGSPVGFVCTNARYTLRNNYFYLNGSGQHAILTGYQMCDIIGNHFTGNVTGDVIHSTAPYDNIIDNFFEQCSCANLISVTGGHAKVVGNKTGVNCAGSACFYVGGSDNEFSFNNLLGSFNVVFSEVDSTVVFLATHNNTDGSSFSYPTPGTSITRLFCVNNGAIVS